MGNFKYSPNIPSHYTMNEVDWNIIFISDDVNFGAYVAYNV